MVKTFDQEVNRQDVPIERRLLSFLEELISELSPDVIVCSDRKGTAVMRALIQEIPKPRLEWSWGQVVSTTAMRHYDWQSKQCRRILLFDELIHHGRSLNRNLTQLKDLIPENSIVTTAAFAVWTGCRADYCPDFAYLERVDSSAYGDIREEIVEMLQRNGSLLLDTEHVELSVQLDCGLTEFYAGLAKSGSGGNVFSFVSGDDRLNLTVHRPRILLPDKLASVLPQGSNIENVVCKCRVIGRTIDRFALMPICYPNLRCDLDPSWLSRLPDFVGIPAIQDGLIEQVDYKYLFQVTGLLTSIELLRSVIAALTPLARKQKIRYEIPRDNLSHLACVFPTLNIDGFWEYLQDIMAESRLLSLPPLDADQPTIVDVPEPVLLDLAAVSLVSILDTYEDENRWPGDPKGRVWNDFMSQKIPESAKGFADAGVEAIWSIVPDRLIDGGIVVTGVEEIVDNQYRHWMVRTFVSDSEVVSHRLTQQLAVRGALCTSQT